MSKYKFFTVEYENGLVELRRVNAEFPEDIFDLDMVREWLPYIRTEYPTEEKVTKARDAVAAQKLTIEHATRSFLGPICSGMIDLHGALHVMNTIVTYVTCCSESMYRGKPGMNTILEHPQEFHRIREQLKANELESELIENWADFGNMFSVDEYNEYRQILLEVEQKLQE